MRLAPGYLGIQPYHELSIFAHSRKLMGLDKVPLLNASSSGTEVHVRMECARSSPGLTIITTGTIRWRLPRVFTTRLKSRERLRSNRRDHCQYSPFTVITIPGVPPSSTTHTFHTIACLVFYNTPIFVYCGVNTTEYKTSQASPSVTITAV